MHWGEVAVAAFHLEATVPGDVANLTLVGVVKQSVVSRQTKCGGESFSPIPIPIIAHGADCLLMFRPILRQSHLGTSQM